MEGPKGSSPFAFYAFYQLYSHLNPGKSSSLSLEDIRRRLYPDFKIDYNEKTSLFITWKKKSNKHHTIDTNEENYILRGCIGTFAKMPIAHGIEKYSLIAALEDRRFFSDPEKGIGGPEMQLQHLRQLQNYFSRWW
ncbi:YOR289W-like protein [Saccharomyces cerevisiae AWRI796]|nr:YOR289W-like protein [Saccharomyces cerevisiae AWRI796]